MSNDITSNIEQLLSQAEASRDSDKPLAESLARQALELLAGMSVDDPRREQLELRTNVELARLEFRAAHYEAALAFLAPYRDSFQTIANDITLRNAVRITALCLDRLARRDEALVLFRQLIELAEADNDHWFIASALNHIGEIFRVRGDHAAALSAYEDALRVARQGSVRDMEYDSINNIALLHSSTLDSSLALEWYLKLLDFEHDGINDARIGGTLINIGNVYKNLGDPRKSLEYQLRGLEHCIRDNNLAYAANARVNAGSAYLALGEYDSAREYLTAALAEQRALGHLGHESLTLSLLAELHHRLGEYDDAIRLSDDAAQIAVRIGSVSLQAKILAQVGEIYTETGDYDAAIDSLERSLSMYSDLGIHENTKNLNKLLADVYRKRGDLPRTLYHIEEHHRIKDEINTAESQEKLHKMQVLHDLESSRSAAEIERLRNVELARALDELKHAQAQLVAAERMASVGQLTAGIAHEINNPINFIHSSLRPLMRDIEDVLGGRVASDDFEEVADEIRGLLRGIESGTTRTAEIVKGLRTFSRLDEDAIKSADLHEGIESALTLLQQRMVNMTLTRNFGSLPMVDCHPGTINQVIMNILSNAIDAVEGSKGTKVQGSKGVIAVRTYCDDAFVCVEISDNGCGIDDADMPRIFEPFFTTKDVGKGTGLGLSIAHGIVEKHGGSIDVVSEPNEGTTFTVRLPFVQVTA